MPWYNSKGEVVPDELVAPMPSPTPTTPPGVTKIPGKTILGYAPPPDIDPERAAYYRSHPKFAAWNKPFTGFVRSTLTGMQADPNYQPPNWMTDIVSPKDWSQTALMALFAVQGLGEAKALTELAEKYPALLPAAKAARAVGANWWRRLGSAGATGYLSSKAAGDPGTRGTTEGVTAGLIGEALGVVRPIARWMGAEGYLEGINNDVAHSIEKDLPVDINPSDIAEHTYGHDIVRETHDNTAGIRREVERKQAASGKQVTMPHIRSDSPAKDVRHPRPTKMSIKKAEKQFNKLSDFIYNAADKPKRNITVRQALEMYRYYKESITTELDAIENGLGQRWRGARDAIHKAEALARTWKNGVVDEVTGKIHPEKWAKAIRDNWDDVVAAFGPKRAEELRAAGGWEKGMTPQVGEAPHISGVRAGLPPHPHGSLGRTTRPPKTPSNILSYWPRGFSSLGAGLPATRVINSQLNPVRRPIPMAVPNPAATPTP